MKEKMQLTYFEFSICERYAKLQLTSTASTTF